MPSLDKAALCIGLTLILSFGKHVTATSQDFFELSRGDQEYLTGANVTLFCYCGRYYIYETTCGLYPGIMINSTIYKRATLNSSLYLLSYDGRNARFVLTIFRVSVALNNTMYRCGLPLFHDTRNFQWSNTVILSVAERELSKDVTSSITVQASQTLTKSTDKSSDLYHSQMVTLDRQLLPHKSTDVSTPESTPTMTTTGITTDSDVLGKNLQTLNVQDSSSLQFIDKQTVKTVFSSEISLTATNVGQEGSRPTFNISFNTLQASSTETIQKTLYTSVTTTTTLAETSMPSPSPSSATPDGDSTTNSGEENSNSKGTDAPTYVYVTVGSTVGIILYLLTIVLIGLLIYFKIKAKRANRRSRRGSPANPYRDSSYLNTVPMVPMVSNPVYSEVMTPMSPAPPYFKEDPSLFEGRQVVVNLDSRYHDVPQRKSAAVESLYDYIDMQ